MAAYAYKSVMFREDFMAAIPRYESKEGVEFEGTCDMDGDAWYVAEFLLNEKDAEIARLKAATPSGSTEGQQ